MSRKHPQAKIDRALSQLTPEDRNDFNNFLKSNSNYPSIKEWFAEKGHDITIQNLSDWHRANRITGKEAAKINLLAESFKGIESEGVLGLALATASKIVEQLTLEIIDNQGIECASIEAKMNLLSNCLRELRQVSTELNNFTTTKETRGLISAGAYAIADELRRIFVATPFAEALESGIQSALIKINED